MLPSNCTGDCHARMVFWVTLGVLFVLLIVLWILWSAFDKAVSPTLCYNQSSFNSSVLKHCPMLLSPYVSPVFLDYANCCVIHDIGQL